MSCQDYQDLVDRGFQRSGNFVYKPVMEQTCCPQYVIRMDSRKFKLSKSQKSCIKKFKRYLVEGNKPTSVVGPNSDSSSVTSAGASRDVEVTSSTSERLAQVPPMQVSKCKKPVRPGLGPDPDKPLCKKAKVMRKERREQKLLAQLQQPLASTSNSTTTSNNVGASDPASRSCDQIESVFCQDMKEFLTFPEDEKCIHKFQTRLVRVQSQEFNDTYEESFQVFKKFQMIIHKESEEDASEKQFNEFLVSTPLKYTETTEKMATSFGTYHQQYLLDDKIFAVGVLDVLPKGVLCEYLYYDPSYRFIAPGVITALLEISLTQQFYLQNPEMKYYYMGFYVQSCPKMNYKRQYSASDLLCPETYTYVPLEKCIPMLKASAYSRLAAEDTENPSECYTMEQITPIQVFADLTAMSYNTYTYLNGNHADTLMKEYVDLVGLQVALRMRLYLGRRNYS